MIGALAGHAATVHADGRQSATFSIARLMVVAPPESAGYVMDPDGNLLAGAVVTVEPTARSAVTDTSGFYRITGVAPGTYTVRATYGGECGLAAMYEDVEVTSDLMLNFLLTSTR